MTLQKTGDVLERRPTIGLVINTIELTAKHINGRKIWLGVMDAAKERDVNVLCFHVDFMSKQPPNDTAKVLYALIDKQNVDGLIFSLHWDPEKFNYYCSRFSSSLPIVNIRRQFDGFSTILPDNYQGMKVAIGHLVEAHNRRRIAYLRGAEKNTFVQQRYRGYIDALSEYNIPFNADLVTPWGGMQSEDGFENVRVLMDERSLRPGIDFDAIAVNNDRMAMGVLDALEARGVCVPHDVAVIGFDGIAGSEFTFPPLTTMTLPYYQMGRQAAETLFTVLEGAAAVPGLVRVPTQICVRQSCGCLPSVADQLAEGMISHSQDGLEMILATKREVIIAEMIRSTDGNEAVIAWSEHVFDAFVAEIINGPSGGFLAKLDEALRPMLTDSETIFLWQAAISVIRTYLRPYLMDAAHFWADDLWRQASVLIGKTAYQAQKHQMLQINLQAGLLRKIGAGLVTIFEIDPLMDKLAEDLPKLDIPSAYLALYENPATPEESARLVLAYTGLEQSRQNEGANYPSPQLLPTGLFPQERQCNFVVESLHFRDQPIGFVIFEVGPLDGNVYAMLSKEISSALQGALLVKQARYRAAQLQASVAVTEAVSQILDPQELAQHVVDLIRVQFDLYYVGLFLLVPGSRLDLKPRKYALLQAGTGEVGRMMVAKHYQLEVSDAIISGQSIVGQCIIKGEACIALDMTAGSERLDNPLLPETRSELALPFISRGEIVGALELCSAHKSAFSQEDVAVFQTMASQLASTLENARLFRQAEEAMDKLRAELKTQVRDGWSQYLRRRR